MAVERRRARTRRVAIVLLSLAALALLACIVALLWYRDITTPPSVIAADAAPPLPAPTIDGPRLAAEWEPATGVLIAWPLRLPRDLITALAADVTLFITAADEENRALAAQTLTGWGLDPTDFQIIIAPQGDGWYGTRDWGPASVLDHSGACHLADARSIDYAVSGPEPDDPIYWLSKLDDLDFSPDDHAAVAVATALAMPRFDVPCALAGGAVDTDGRGTVFVTDAVLRENAALGVPVDRLFATAAALLGISRFIVLPRYEEMGVHHVDCLLKVLDEERILLKRAPRDHPEHDRIEAAGDVLSRHVSATGRPYRILRIDTPRYRDDELANYTNALILNRRVYVPLFGIAADAAALATWREAMPGYAVEGFLYGGEEGWTYTDAIHCRTRAIHGSP